MKLQQPKFETSSNNLARSERHPVYITSQASHTARHSIMKWYTRDFARGSKKKLPIKCGFANYTTVKAAQSLGESLSYLSATLIISGTLLVLSLLEVVEISFSRVMLSDEEQSLDIKTYKLQNWSCFLDVHLLYYWKIPLILGDNQSFSLGFYDLKNFYFSCDEPAKMTQNPVS